MPCANQFRPILLVEDNQVDIDLTRHAFARSRIANPLDVARKGEEVLDWIKRWDDGELTPAVILLDLKLPGISGLEVLCHLKEHSRYKSIPVVMLTNSSDSTDITAAYNSGANSYIVKPVDFDKFMAIAEQIKTYWGVINELPL